MQNDFPDPNTQFARELIDSAPDAIVIVNSKGVIVLANQMASLMFGYSNDELMEERVEKLIPTRNEQAHIAHRQEYISSPHVRPMGANMDLVAKRKDGSEFSVEISLSPLETASGTMVISIVRDITGRRSTEDLLQASENRFRKIFEHSNDAIYLVDTKRNTIKDMNPTACRMLGYTRDEFLELKVSDIHPNEMPQLLAFADKVFDRGGGWTDELTCRTKTGTFLPAEISASVVEIEGQDYMIAMVRDTTERKLAEERIAREAARTESLARIAARLNAHLTLHGVLEAACEEIVAAMQSSAAAVLLYDAKTGSLAPSCVLGLPVGYPAEYEPMPRSIYDNYVQAQGPIVVISDLQAEKGLPNTALYKRIGIRTVVAASMLREGELIGTLNAYSLVEERAFSEDELALLQGLADQAAQAVENARLREQAQLGAITDERTRLARDLHDSVAQALYGVTLSAAAGERMLLSKDLDSAENQLIKIRAAAEEALREMRLLIYELRPPDLAAMGLAGALKARIENVEQRSGMKTSIDVMSELQLEPEVEDALYRIALEALNNVLKHAQAKSVLLSLGQSDGIVQLEVVDDGVGFKPDISGGLGLRGMKERTQNLGGEFNLESNEGSGTRVRVIFNTSVTEADL